MHLAQELRMNLLHSGDSSFANETESLEDEKDSGWPSEADNDQLRESLNYTRSCQRTQHQPFYDHSAFETNWKGEKADRKFF